MIKLDKPVYQSQKSEKEIKEMLRKANIFDAYIQKYFPGVKIMISLHYDDPLKALESHYNAMLFMTALLNKFLDFYGTDNSEAEIIEKLQKESKTIKATLQEHSKIELSPFLDMV